MNTKTITPIEFGVRLRIRPDREITDGVKDTIMRWLDRHAHRNGHFANRPSVTVEMERVPELRRTYLYGFIDALPNGSPSWLAEATIDRHRVNYIEPLPVEVI